MVGSGSASSSAGNAAGSSLGGGGGGGEGEGGGGTGGGGEGEGGGGTGVGALACGLASEGAGAGARGSLGSAGGAADASLGEGPGGVLGVAGLVPGSGAGSGSSWARAGAASKTSTATPEARASKEARFMVFPSITTLAPRGSPRVSATFRAMKGAMEGNLVRVTTEGSVRVLQMDDGKANALSPAMVRELGAALDDAEKHGAAVVLAGRPGRFCAGFDLKVMMTSVEAAKSLVASGGELLLRLYTYPRPLVVACGGHALAGGALVVLTGDVRLGIATAPTRIGLNEVAIGMPLPILAMELARDRLVSQELGRATLQATTYTPDEAKVAGYLDDVVSEAELLPRALAEATRLAALAAPAYAATKERLRERTCAYIRDTMASDMARLVPPAS